MKGFLGLGLAFFAMTSSHVAVRAADSFDFASYQVGKIFRGNMMSPAFDGRDKDFAPFKTRIMAAMKSGVSFAGEYSVAQFGCGTGCTNVVVANNRTGQLHAFPRGGEFNQALTLAYTVNSNLVLVRWYTDSLWETCVFESFLFEDGNWLANDAFAAKGEEICEGDVLEGAAKARAF